MGWASNLIKKLKAGETVTFRPIGNSMTPRIKSKQLCTVEPATDIQIDDVVLCKVQGREYLHIVKAIKENDKGYHFQIGNNYGYINGWTSRENIFGKLIKVE